MKRILLITAAIACLSLQGCGDNSALANQGITTLISTGVSLAFRYVPMGDNKTLIARYVSGIAGGARALTGNETNEQVAEFLAAKVPADVLHQLPAIGTTVIPQVVGYYENAKKQFGSNHQAFLDRMNAVANGLEQGVSGFIKA